MKKVRGEEIEFFTFLTGLQNKELFSLEALINSFPYKSSHKINILDKSEKLKEKFKNKSKIFHSEKHYIIKNELDFDFDYWNLLKEKYKENINIIEAETYSTHVEGVHEILSNYSSKKFSVIMDSDIKFINSKYLDDIIKILQDFNNDNNLAAIGEIYQEVPFSLPFKKKFSQEFYKLFLNDSRVTLIKILRNFLLFFKNGKKLYNERMHKLPRIFTSLILINSEIYNKHKMNFNYLWFEALDFYKNEWLSHRVMGDAGSALLFQIAQNDKKIVNLPYSKYVIHSRKGSRPTLKKDLVDKNWYRFDY